MNAGECAGMESGVEFWIDVESHPGQTDRMGCIEAPPSEGDLVAVAFPEDWRIGRLIRMTPQALVIRFARGDADILIPRALIDGVAIVVTVGAGSDATSRLPA